MLREGAGGDCEGVVREGAGVLREGVGDGEVCEGDVFEGVWREGLV